MAIYKKDKAENQDTPITHTWGKRLSLHDSLTPNLEKKIFPKMFGRLMVIDETEYGKTQKKKKLKEKSQMQTHQ